SRILKSPNLDGIYRPRRCGCRQDFGSFQDFDLYRRRTGAYQIDLTRRAEREVDDAAVNKRSAIIDPYIHFAAVGLVRDANNRIERQRAMGCRQFPIAVEDFPA